MIGLYSRAHPEFQASSPGMNETEIVQIETEIGGRLPGLFREWLQECGNETFEFYANDFFSSTVFSSREEIVEWTKSFHKEAGRYKLPHLTNFIVAGIIADSYCLYDARETLNNANPPVYLLFMNDITEDMFQTGLLSDYFILVFEREVHQLVEDKLSDYLNSNQLLSPMRLLSRIP